MPDKTSNPLNIFSFTAALILSLTGCDIVQQELRIEDPTPKAPVPRQKAKPSGGVCRQSGRAIEDCYAIYSWLPKARIYESWRDMDAYMRENKMETVEPQLPPVPAPGTRKKHQTNCTTKRT